MIRCSHLPNCVALLFVPLLGRTSGESVEKNMGAVPSGLRAESKEMHELEILASETQKPFQFHYALTNTSDQEKVLRLTRISCGCAVVSVTSGTETKSLARGDVFTIRAQENVTVTLDVRLAGKPIGLHNFPTEFAVVNAGSEETFSLPEPRVRILADVSVDPPVLSHQFRWNEDPVVEKCITITTRQKIEDGKHLPAPKFGSLPSYIALKELRKLEAIEPGKYRTEEWMAAFILKKPITEDYTVAASIMVFFSSSPLHTITIPSVVTAKRGVEARPRSLTFTSENSTQNEKRLVLITATDGRPFSVTRIAVRSGFFRAKARESKTSVSYLIEVAPVAAESLPQEDSLEIETDHPDTPSISVPLSRAG